MRNQARRYVPASDRIGMLAQLSFCDGEVRCVRPPTSTNDRLAAVRCEGELARTDDGAVKASPAGGLRPTLTAPSTTTGPENRSVPSRLRVHSALAEVLVRYVDLAQLGGSGPVLLTSSRSDILYS